MHPRITITTEGGERAEALAPVIVSASRSTDIPAFYAEWLLGRLRKGYCVWRNPFSGRPSYVSFARCRVIVFWTKNPEPIMPLLPELDRRGIRYYFHFTLNDYDAEGFEPNVPPVERRVRAFRSLADAIGKERVIWRYDPILVSPRLTPDVILGRIGRLGDALRGCAERLIFSFIDVRGYRNVQANLSATQEFGAGNALCAEPTAMQRAEIVRGLAALRDRWRAEGWDMTLAACAEEEDVYAHGIERSACVDAELMKRIFAGDAELVYYLHTLKWPEAGLFGIPPIPAKARSVKDPGQRKACGCMVSKDIGVRSTCRHFCVYCYANASRESVLRNAEWYDAEGECLVKGFKGLKD